MSLPVPLPTDPAADAAVHIRNLADAVSARLAAGTVVPFSFGEQTSDANGTVTLGSVSAQLATVTGVLLQPMQVQAGHVVNGVDDILYMSGLPMRDDTGGTTIRVTARNPPTDGRLALRKLRYCGLAFGTRAAAAAAEAPAPLANPGDTFPAGSTAQGLRYPGTSDPQYRTAAAIGNLADDIGVRLGGAPTGLNFYTHTGVFTSNANALLQFAIPGMTRRVQGCLIQAVDLSGSLWQARMFGYYAAGEWPGVPVPDGTVAFMLCDNEAQGTGSPPRKLNSTAVGVAVLAWG